MARLRAPIDYEDHFGTSRTGICTSSYDGARVLLVSELFGSRCNSYEPFAMDLERLLTEHEE